MAFNEDSSASGHDEPWIQWFCGLKGHEMFCEVERSYIEDGFNLYGLRACVSNFSDCLDLILDRIGPDDSDDSHLTQSACTLYGLIHARYIITAHGLDAMYNKYAAKEFGTCPLIQCQGQPVLPVGLKDEMGADTVKIFCPKCNQVYHTPPVRSRAGNSSGVDGAAFGTTFPHLFLMTFSNLVPDPLSAESAYVPRVFGFRVHRSARQRNGSAATAAANAAAAADAAASLAAATASNNTLNSGSGQLEVAAAAARAANPEAADHTNHTNTSGSTPALATANNTVESKPPPAKDKDFDDESESGKSPMDPTDGIVPPLAESTAAVAAAGVSLQLQQEPELGDEDDDSTTAPKPQPLVAAGNGAASNAAPGLDDEDVKPRARPSKRRKDAPLSGVVEGSSSGNAKKPGDASGGGGTGNASGAAGSGSGGGGGPTFLLENSAKRRRRNNNGNS